MPLIDKPHHTTAVILFGSEACERLDDLLHYMGLALSPMAWPGFIFVRVAGRQLPDPQPPEGVHVRGYNQRCAAEAGEALVDKKIVADLRSMMAVTGPLQLHCICGDFQAPAMPADYPVRYARKLCQAFPAADIDVRFYAMLHEHDAARAAQRDFAGALRQLPQDAPAITYLLSQTIAGGAAISAFNVWRAIACLVVANAVDAFPHLSPKRVYSVGYVGLNAQDSELTALRRMAVQGEMDKLRQREIPPQDAWTLMTGEAAKAESFSMATAEQFRQMVAQWLCRLADAYLPRPTEQELDNLRILCAIGDVADIDHALRSFYGCNCAMAGDAEASLPGRYARERVLACFDGQIRPRFLGLPNMEQFPLEEMRAMIRALESIAEAPLRRERGGDYPRRSLMERKRDYLNRCIRQRSDEMRREYVRAFCRALAPELRDRYAALYDTLARIQQEGALKRRVQADAYSLIELRDRKYKAYWAALSATLQQQSRLFGNGWSAPSRPLAETADVDRPLYRPDGSLDEDMLERFITRAMALAHRRMPEGYNSSFIEALSRQNESIAAMHDFLSAYLPEPRMMFRWVGDQTPQALQQVYFIDERLAGNPWVEEEPHRYIIRNDNVEQLCVYDTHLTLDDLLADGSLAASPFSPPGTGVDFGNDSATVWGSRQRSAAVPEAADVPDTAPDMPQIAGSLSADGETLRVTWPWPEDASSMRYQLNDGAPKILTRGEYGIGLALTAKTSKIRYGRNDLTVFLGNVPYASGSFPGLMQKVRAQIKRGEMQLVIPKAKPGGMYSKLKATGAQAPFPIEENAAFQLALLSARRAAPGEEADTLLYPVCAARDPHREGDTALRFAGLEVDAGAHLMHSPIYPYPTLTP